MVSRQPTLFVGHGSPTNAIESNQWTAAWRAIGDTIGTPRAVLCVSAHWYTNTTAVTAMPAPRTIHDFYGFPDELFAVEYPAPGAPEIAELVAETVKPRWVGLDADSWGLDHGTWSVLVHMYPDADIPVVQLSIDASETFDYHFEIGTRLAPLRDQGVVIVGSGNIVHNLRRLDWHAPGSGFAWNRRFDEAARAVLADDPAEVLGLVDHPDFAAAVPTPDHFIPLLHVAGAASADGERLADLVTGYAFGSLSMTCVGAGVTIPTTDGTTGTDPGALPDPEVVPPQRWNM